MIEIVFLDYCPRPLECHLNAKDFYREVSSRLKKGLYSRFPMDLLVRKEWLLFWKVDNQVSWKEKDLFHLATLTITHHINMVGPEIIQSRR